MVSGDSYIRDKIEIKVPCKAEYVRTVRRTVADFAHSADMPDSAVEELEIAASEAVANIVRHAYSGCEKTMPVWVKCACGREGLTVEVIDRGRGFAAPPDGITPEVDLDREGGIGIILIKCLMDSVNYTSMPRQGTRIRMTKRMRETVLRAPVRLKG